MKKLVALLLVIAVGNILAFESCPAERCEDSCKNRCGHKPNKRYTCQCNEHCERFRDCCEDYSKCKYIDPNFNKDAHFKVSDADSNYIDDAQFEESGCEDSCKNRCGHKPNKRYTCQCNEHCERFRDCCEDYSKCKSNTIILYFTDIDPNFNKDAHFKVSDADSNYIDDAQFEESGGVISNEELKEISEKIYKSDVNKAAESDIVLNKQEMVNKNGKKMDLSDEVLYKHVNEDLFKKPTYAAFIALLNNYERHTGTDDTYSHAEIKEQEHFLKEIMKTKIMKELFKFFQKKGLYKTEKEFSDDLQKMWFGLYSRSSGEKDSSGFEHVFVGEVKKNKVSGSHSWIQFYLLEKKGMLDYYSHNYDGPWTSFPDVLGKQFNWDGYVKEVGSQFIGSSPEFDFALYSLCFISRPGKKCKLSMGGHEIYIQTYEWTKDKYGNGKKFIATAYPLV
ncbi:uridylate-specific endoribonuclease [Gastrophryne carolinensis]